MTIGLEDRVIAEAPLTPRLRQQRAPPQPLGNQRARIVSRGHPHHHAVEIRSHRCRHILAACQQMTDVLGIQPCPATCLQGLALDRVGDCVQCKARRTHAGRTTQGRHAQAGIVRQRGQPTQACTVPGLGQRIFHEAGPRLLGIGNPQLGLAGQTHAARCQHGPQLLQLAGIARRHQPMSARHAPSSCKAARCSRTSSSMPLAARSSSSLACWREKGAPSAVPWISTRPPEAVITTFMSVSQPESSW